MQQTNHTTNHSHPLGSPTSWAIDFAIIGFASALLAPLLIAQGLIDDSYFLATSIAGGVVGGGLGAILPWLLKRVAKRVPFGVLLFAGPVVGAVWGGVTGVVGGVVLIAGHHQFASELASASVLFASIAGALQFGWLWLPYTLLRAKGRRTWGVVVAACATPVLGFAALWFLT